jgi:tetratricopeptide (TPR) repeat protein
MNSSNLSKANDLYNNAEYSKALPLLEELLKDNFDSIEIHQKLARSFFQIKNYQRALKEYTELGTKDSNNAKYQYFIGRCYSLLKKDELAKQAHLKALEIDSDYMFSNRELAELLIFSSKVSSDWEKALKIYKDKILIAKNQNWANYSNFSVGCKKLNRWDECLNALEKAHELAPKQISPLKKIATYFTKRNLPKALNAINKWIELDPESKDPYVIGIRTAIENKEDNLLIHYYEQIKQAIPSFLCDDYIACNVVTAYLAKNQIKLARACYNSLKDLHGGDPDFDGLNRKIKKKEQTIIGIDLKGLNAIESEWVCNLHDVFIKYKNTPIAIGGFAFEYNEPKEESDDWQIEASVYAYDDIEKHEKMVKTYCPETEFPEGNEFFTVGSKIKSKISLKKIVDRSMQLPSFQNLKLQPIVFFSQQEHDAGTKFYLKIES